MSIIEKIKESVEASTGQDMHYYAAGDLNTIFDGADFPCSYSFLLESGAVNDENGRLHEKVTLGVFFVNTTDYDCNALENEQIIQPCMQSAFEWLTSLKRSQDLLLESINSTQRVYDEFDVIVTGYGVNVTISDIEGYGSCDFDAR